MLVARGGITRHVSERERWTALCCCNVQPVVCLSVCLSIFVSIYLAWYASTLLVRGARVQTDAKAFAATKVSHVQFTEAEMHVSMEWMTGQMDYWMDYWMDVWMDVWMSGHHVEGRMDRRGRLSRPTAYTARDRQA